MKINTAESREKRGKLRCIGLHTCASGLFWHETDAAPMRHERMYAGWAREVRLCLFSVHSWKHFFYMSSAPKIHKRVCMPSSTYICLLYFFFHELVDFVDVYVNRAGRESVGKFPTRRFNGWGELEIRKRVSDGGKFYFIGDKRKLVERETFQLKWFDTCRNFFLNYF